SRSPVPNPPAWRGLAAAARTLFDYVGAALFLAMFLCFVLQVSFRYFLKSPQAWTDEASVVLFVILACWASALMTPWREHVTLDVLVTAVPDRVRRGMRAAGLAALAIAFALALPSAIDLTRYMAGRVTPVLDINMAILSGSFVLFLAALALRAVVGIVQIFRRRA
ncbi:MAG: TRAP transporter small permease subunit, partial [Burkholderiales bacterium]|nr:TRAP transporter small permease subunit [Burkholderiales bacterium]